MKNILGLLLIVGLCFSCHKKEEIQQESNRPTVFNGGETTVGDVPWKVENSISVDDTNHVLMMNLKEKYDGYHNIYAMAFFSNEKTRQYKAVAPWCEDVKFNWENVTSKSALKILYDSIPKDRTDVLNTIENWRASRKSKP